VTIVIFGGGGDLAHRKLLPALYNLQVDGLLPNDIVIVGVGRKETSDDAYRQFARDGITQFSRRPIEAGAWQTFEARLYSATATIDGESSMGPLGARLDIIEHERNLKAERVYYLALPSSLFVPTVKQLQKARFVSRSNGASTRIVVEKPIGTDLKSACAINDAIAEVFDEPQIYRIDHYLGKETVQNILVMRFANSIFEPLFNQHYVDHVQITVAEEEGVGTRAGYYEQAGALRDMVQNHMLQLLSLVAMEPPHSLDGDVIRDEKLEVLQSLRPLRGADIDTNVVRAQYAGYSTEPGVAPTSRIETYVALRIFIDNWRWYGVPFLLRTGKRLRKRSSEISIHLKELPPILFNANPEKRLEPNILAIRIQPDEGFSLGISCKHPGPRIDVQPVKMDFHYGEMFGASSPEAYERLLLDVMAGDPTLFMRRDAVETAWRWAMPVLDRWAEHTGPLPTYVPGSWGPAEGDRLIESIGRKWRPL
jgi:glucose-6-phosphate 1-dehydrogenase